MILLGITGGIGHGKSTLAEAFARLEPMTLHLELSDAISEVANALHANTTSIPNPHNLADVLFWLQPLPAIVQQIIHQPMNPVSITPEDIAAQPALYEKLFAYLEAVRRNPSLLTAQITPANKGDYRAILQWLGAYLVATVDKSIWCGEMVRRAKVAAVEQGIQLCTIGGLRYPTDAETVRNASGDIILVRRPLFTEQDISDPTERERNKIVPDTTLVNDADLARLVACAQQILNDLRLGKLKSHYAASEL